MTDTINIDQGERRLAVLSAWSKSGEDGPYLDFESPGRLKTVLARHPEKRLTVTLALDLDRRSNEANRYLWGVVYQEILTEIRGRYEEQGDACPWKRPEDVHRAMKYIILGDVEEDVLGVKIVHETPTRTMTTAQFSAFVERVKAIAAERWSIYVSEPGFGRE